jgi:hypothetical protein
MKSVRIIKEGHTSPTTGIGTRVVDAETGEELQYVTGVDIRIRLDEPVKATIYLLASSFDVVCEPDLRSGNPPLKDS